MGITTLILGRSGTGKSSSIETLDPKETFVINVLDKPLPMRGFKKKYVHSKNECAEGNYYRSDKSASIVKVVKAISATRPDIKNIILDDAHYIMANEYFRRNDEKGYTKYGDIGANIVSVMDALNGCRDDILVFIMWHPELEDDGEYKCKTIGKSVDSKYGIEGVSIHMLFTKVTDSGYFFITNHDGVFPAKTPKGMFPEKLIPNDLQLVRDRIIEYYNDQEEALEKL